MKWHLPSSSAAEHRGRTGKAHIHDHKASWDYSKEIPVRLTIDKSTQLQQCEVHFEIIQEYNELKGGRVHLGNVKLNLAEYTRMPEAFLDEDQDGTEDGMITRRYLMQDSKVNATLKIGIAMKQVEGDTNFFAPPLKSAMVVGGIAGVVNADADGTDDMPSVASKSRELSEAQDIYRRTLAASWACERGELPPDKLIEDLFGGGDGGRPHPPAGPGKRHATNRIMSREDSSTSSDADSRRVLPAALLAPNQTRNAHRTRTGGDYYHSDKIDGHSSTSLGVSGRGSIEQQMQHSHRHHGAHSAIHDSHIGHGRRSTRDYNELTEFDLREDLRSWVVDAH